MLDGFSGYFLRLFEIKSFCFVVAIFDLVHTADVIFPLPLQLTASGNLF